MKDDRLVHRARTTPSCAQAGRRIGTPTLPMPPGPPLQLLCHITCHVGPPHPHLGGGPWAQLQAHVGFRQEHRRTVVSPGAARSNVSGTESRNIGAALPPMPRPRLPYCSGIHRRAHLDAIPLPLALRLDKWLVVVLQAIGL